MDCIQNHRAFGLFPSSDVTAKGKRLKLERFESGFCFRNVLILALCLCFYIGRWKKSKSSMILVFLLQTRRATYLASPGQQNCETQIGV